MKKSLRLVLVAVLCLVSFSTFADIRGKQKISEGYTRIGRYEIECIGVGKEGTYVLKVWTYSKKMKVAIEAAKRNAVHGVIFKGFPGVNGYPSQKPIISNPAAEKENEKYFEEFFEQEGPYVRYVTQSNDGKKMYDVVKLKRDKEFKVGMVVIVAKDELRKRLEADKVIRGLSSGF